MGLVDSNIVDFTIFQMHGSTKRWWKVYEKGMPAGLLPLTWFNQAMVEGLEKFISFTKSEELHNQFECLQEGSMTVTQYETRFVDLSRHSAILVPTVREKVRKFIEGLIYGIIL
ncbi:uncharacterized protein [Nicotiana tomentosiformis]|uniref:uncharacterized protein n=1 Tax=Nicotiana tomentosiformis TaxID=4098 RepID=UPI00388C67EC